MSYTVVTGISTTLSRIDVVWDATTPPGSPARIGVYKDPNDDGIPHDVAGSNVLRDTAPDAAGTFVVDVLHDESMGHQSFLVARFVEKIDIRSVTPAVIQVAR